MRVPRGMMFGLAVIALCAVTFAAAAPAADDDPVSIDVPNKEAWMGQRLPIFVQLRGNGPFVGAASFSIPEIPRALLVKVGSPVVSSEEKGDTSWFMQTHEFALFSQAAGKVTIPAFEVRFTHRDGFTGPQQEHVEQVPATDLQIKRPVGLPESVFLVTTEKLEITESWTPEPGSAKQGDVFRRTIAQTAQQTSGMALAPPPTTAPEGISVYVGKPTVDDKTQRGEFSGTRSDTITYMLKGAGTLTIPGIKYIWWNPKSEEFGTKTLPAVTFEVAAAPKPAPPPPPPPSRMRIALAAFLLFSLLGVAIWQFDRIRSWTKTLWRRLNPADRVAARHLIRACHRNDAAAAEAAWTDWQNTQPASYQPSAELFATAAELHRTRYGQRAEASAAWQGQPLAQAFRKATATSSATQNQQPPLPPLNPRST
ncbi:BatD family protein [Rosistilla oblonga]|uniref:DUF7939 domain-containing protein n=1 Tax=Rosistilla oblonga TaxID=2527990 RepID=A0A518J1M3_9BACT|nr:BatD family protein [Rosistilla oblonga]QDV59232.1 hypothetical protein Mal33_52600 [Rosistilla oblonga]